MADWTLEDFDSKFAEWIAEEEPPFEVEVEVAMWWGHLPSHPFHCAASVPQMGGRVYMGRILVPNEGGRSVMCLYTVHDDSHTLRCSFFRTVDVPPEVT